MAPAACRPSLLLPDKEEAMGIVLTVVALVFVLAMVLLALWVFVIAPIVIPLRDVSR
jgi:hypothetical protein